MISTIVWNAKGINTQGVVERLKNLKNIHHVSMIVVLEPFSDNNNINMFKSMLAMDNATSNINGKIWLFWTTDISCTVLETDEQQITCEISHTEVQGIYIKTFVSAKCKEYLKEPLWDRLLHFADTRDTTPCCTIGEEKLIDEIPMQCIPRMVSQEHNDSLKRIPSIEELKEVVYSMSPNSTGRTDGLNGYFFRMLAYYQERFDGCDSVFSKGR
ncbi:hypothetical protein H5410_003032 [Solanum commersonii]|uniref:Uncharacterized protein n=1 Tax=Solanum commersonii TaxID=4109 RepID=A0A9J6B3W2_SOLCO|nr:hypothetical protein H5410_003032 [Solanum commersonii]